MPNGRFLPHPVTTDPEPNILSESSLTLSSLSSLFPSPVSSRSRTPFTPATSPAPPIIPATLHAALTVTTTVPRTPPRRDNITDTTVKLFKGDNVGENATDFLNGIRCHFLTTSTYSEEEKIKYFELSLKDGSYVSL
jgi:hypothetical protein